MRDVLKRLASASAVYGIGGTLQRALAFIVIPIYTRHLSVSEYGVLSLLIITANAALIFMQAGVGSALFREVIYHESDGRIAESTAFYFTLGQAVLITGILWGLAPRLSSAVFGSSMYGGLLRLALLSVALQMIEVIALAHFRIQRQTVLYVTFSIMRLALSAAVTFLFVVVRRMGLSGAVEAILVSSAAFLAPYLLVLRHALRPRVSRDALRRMLSFSIPLIPAALTTLVLIQADRYLLVHYRTAAEVGIYSLGCAIGLGLQLVVQAVQLAWPAELYVIAREQNGPETMGRIVTYYAALVACAALFIAVFARDVIIVVATPPFYPAYRVVPFVVVSGVLYGLYFMTSSGVQVTNRMLYQLPSLIIAASVNLGLNWLLIPTRGMMGAAVAMLGSYSVLILANVSINNWLWRVQYEYARLAKLAAVWLIIYVASTFTGAGLISALLLKTALVALFPALLYAVRFMTAGEWGAALDFLRRRQFEAAVSQP